MIPKILKRFLPIDIQILLLFKVKLKISEYFRDVDNDFEDKHKSWLYVCIM